MYRKSRHEKYIIKRYFFLFVFCMELLAIVVIQHMIFFKAGQNDKNNEKQNLINQSVSRDMDCFPIPISYRNRIYYEDSYGAGRIQGEHEGCDIMDRQDTPGEIPIVSCCSGTVTNIGWLFLGGYRIGITGKNGTYFYYAHLSSYANGLELGDPVWAGQFIGFMGNSGEGKEGTTGKFPTHLHLGIYSSHQEMKAVNPYFYLKNKE